MVCTIKILFLKHLYKTEENKITGNCSRELYQGGLTSMLNCESSEFSSLLYNS